MQMIRFLQDVFLPVRTLSTHWNTSKQLKHSLTLERVDFVCLLAKWEHLYNTCFCPILHQAFPAKWCCHGASIAGLAHSLRRIMIRMWLTCGFCWSLPRTSHSHVEWKSTSQTVCTPLYWMPSIKPIAHCSLWVVLVMGKVRPTFSCLLVLSIIAQQLQC